MVNKKKIESLHKFQDIKSLARRYDELIREDIDSTKDAVEKNLKEIQYQFGRMIHVASIIYAMFGIELEFRIKDQKPRNKWNKKKTSK